MILSRGQFLACLAAPLTGQAAEELVDFSDYPPDFRTDVQSSSPRVKSFDLRRLTTWRTPAEEFFTFHQGKTVEHLDLKSWRLQISGSVARPRKFTFADLRRLPAKEIAAVVECSGNNGHPGLMNGLVSNGVWKGIELAPLLRECGILPEAREVVFFGADAERERKWPAGDREFEAPHGRSIFLQDALEGGAILASELNGLALSPERGYPLRLIVPGWYGMTQIKWLNRIVVLDRRYEGRHMARNYHSIRTLPENLVLETSIARMRLKSVVARVTRGSVYTISGAAWGGSVDRIQVQIDDRPWQDAAVIQKGSPHSWSFWQIPWKDASPGTHKIVSRAIDSQGRIQPVRSEFASAREDNSQWIRHLRL
jgi:DMSO/TMAO reductase YedYZ molybdopterin-dependent catalytic subunit